MTRSDISLKLFSPRKTDSYGRVTVPILIKSHGRAIDGAVWYSGSGYNEKESVEVSVRAGGETSIDFKLESQWHMEMKDVPRCLTFILKDERGNTLIYETLAVDHAWFRGALKSRFDGGPFGLVDGKLNAVVCGWYGAGKSAFINSIKMVMHASNSGESLPYTQPTQEGTEQTTTELVPVDVGGGVPLLLWDTMGFSMDSYQGNELEAVFQGRLPPGCARPLPEPLRPPRLRHLATRLATSLATRLATPHTSPHASLRHTPRHAAPRARLTTPSLSLCRSWKIRDALNTQMLAPPSTLQEEVERYNRTPHVCIFAMHYDMLDDTDGDAMTKLKAEFRKIIALGVMPIVIVTQIDRQEEVDDPRNAKIRADPLAKDHVFKEEKLRQAAAFFGIPNGQVYACVNYVDMDAKSWALDRHLWLILHRVLSSAKQRCETQQQLAQTRARLSGAGAAGGSPMLDRLANLQQEVSDAAAQRTEAERREAAAVERGDGLAEQLDASQQRLGEALGANTALGERLRRTESERDRATAAAAHEAERRAASERAREAAARAAEAARREAEAAKREAREADAARARAEAAAAAADLSKAQADASAATAAEQRQAAGQAVARSAAEATAARAAAAAASKKGRAILGLAALAVLCSGPLCQLLGGGGVGVGGGGGAMPLCEQLMLPPGMGGMGGMGGGGDGGGATMMGGFADTNDSGVGWDDVVDDAAGPSPPPRPPTPSSFHVASQQQPWPASPSPSEAMGRAVLYGTTVALFLTAVYFLKPAKPLAVAAAEQPQQPQEEAVAAPPAAPPAPASPSSSGEQWAMVDDAPSS